MPLAAITDAQLRVGAVNYLNSKPLVRGLAELAPRCRLLFDLPSRLADSLASGRLDVALIPTVEYFRAENYQVVSDACVASRDEVRSVKLYFRTPPAEVRTLALDEGSRTSAALAQVMLADRHECTPGLIPLPIGEGPETVDADAVLVIGDRAMLPPPSGFQAEWDLGAEWRKETGLPFVFACWAAHDSIDAHSIAPALSAARDAGLTQLDSIAREEAPRLGVGVESARDYLQNHLHYHLGEPEKQAMRLFSLRCQALGLLEPAPCARSPPCGGNRPASKPQSACGRHSELNPSPA